MKKLSLATLLVLVLGGGASARLSSAASVATPVITEPATDGQVINPFDVHMVAGPFAGAPGEAHVCSDWEIRSAASDELVWSAACATGAGKVHVHLGDGAFTGSLDGRHQLSASSLYRLRVRFLGDAAPQGTDWSDWAVREFATTAATAIQPIRLSDVSAVPPPRWRDDTGNDVVLPAEGPGSGSLRLEVLGGGTVLTFAGLDGTVNRVSNPAPVGAHGALRVIVRAGSAPLDLPASTVFFTDGSGEDREVDLPPIALAAESTASWWIAEGGGAFTDGTGGDPAAAPVFDFPVTEPPVPWAVKQPGFRVERVATGFRLPVNIAFVPDPGPAAGDPLYYVSELYGSVKVVSRAGTVSDYATGLLNFDPVGPFPGTGEKGVAGIVVDPGSGDVYVSSVFAVPGVADFHFPEVQRLHSLDGGMTAATRNTILQFPDELMGASHQTSNLTIGPDGKLYVHVGDGLLTTPAQDPDSVRGKILRVNLDGSAPADNPFYDATDGLTPRDLVFASGLRNPFGGAWRQSDGSHWEVENGPGRDRLAKIVAGRNYLWDGTDASMAGYAAYNWFPSHAPVNIAFVQLASFAGSGFPADRLDHAFVSESGPTYAAGPQDLGKRIVEFVLDADGNLVRGPMPLLEYLGSGRGTAVGLAAGPGGLYFTDLYKDFGASTPTEPGASVFRIVWTGVADFTAQPQASGRVPLDVQFRDASNVPSAEAWHWEFGDGETSDEHEPHHVYRAAGAYDVRLTVTGAPGSVSRQKASFVEAQPAARGLQVPPRGRPTPRIVPPKAAGRQPYN